MKNMNLINGRLIELGNEIDTAIYYERSRSYERYRDRLYETLDPSLRSGIARKLSKEIKQLP